MRGGTNLVTLYCTGVSKFREGAVTVVGKHYPFRQTKKYHRCQGQKRSHEAVISIEKNRTLSGNNEWSAKKNIFWKKSALQFCAHVWIQWKLSNEIRCFWQWYPFFLAGLAPLVPRETLQFILVQINASRQKEATRVSIRSEQHASCCLPVARFPGWLNSWGARHWRTTEILSTTRTDTTKVNLKAARCSLWRGVGERPLR